MKVDAFPMVVSVTGSEISRGLSKKEYYAAKCLAALVSSPLAGSKDQLCKLAVELAECLIKELEGTNE